MSLLERVLHKIDALILRAFSPIVEPYLCWRQRRQRAKWDRDWERESQRPVSQLSTIVPRELVEAVESGWIPPSSSVLDVGSGRGQVAAWLAEQGFRVLGADISEEATNLAKRHFEHLSGRLEFRTIDFCVDPPDGAQFDVLFDRGCLHIILPAMRPRYVANLAARARAGARLLLLSRVSKGHSESQLVAELRELFDPYFEVIRTQSAAEPNRRSVGPVPRDETRAVVFWMIRRAFPEHFGHIGCKTR